MRKNEIDFKQKGIFMSVEQEIKEIIVEQLGVEASEIDAKKSFVEDLNADSLDLTELIMTFEEKFGLEISESDAEQLKTVGDVIAFISKKKINT